MRSFGFKLWAAIIAKGKCPHICTSEPIVLEISSIKLKLHWILQVSDPPNKFRGIKIRFSVFFFFVIFLLNFGNQKKSLWPPVVERTAPGVRAPEHIRVGKDRRIYGVIRWRWCDINSIVEEKKKMCRERIFFSFFSSLGLFWFFLIIILFYFLLFFFFTSSSERGVFRKQKTDFSINKLDLCHRSQGLLVEALKLPIWKLKKKRKKTKVQFRYCLSFTKKKRFSVCWKQQCCDNLKNKIAVHLYCHIVFQYWSIIRVWYLYMK